MNVFCVPFRIFAYVLSTGIVIYMPPTTSMQVATYVGLSKRYICHDSIRFTFFIYAASVFLAVVV
jgi:hypothetical protein